MIHAKNIPQKPMTFLASSNDLFTYDSTLDGIIFEEVGELTAEDIELITEDCLIDTFEPCTEFPTNPTDSYIDYLT